MKVSNIFTCFKAVISIEVEGFFIERFINLCKINNIKVWDIVYLNSGKIRCSCTPKEYRKLKPYLRKTKCKSKITKRKGVYFELFRYRKRRSLFALIILLLALWIVLSTFVWKINITGNERVKSGEIIQILKDANVGIGKNKFFISKGDAVDFVRKNIYDIAWIGLEYSGTTLNIKVVEKTIEKIEEDPSEFGNIVSTKAGIITKIIAKNGTALYKTGSYIPKRAVAIEGSIKSEFVEERKVHASGILRAAVEYKFEKEYFYEESVKEYTSKKRHGIGAEINNKKIVLKYLRKENKYDISSKVKNFDIFGIKISFILNTYEEYDVIKNQYSLEELLNKGKNDSKEYIQKLLTDGNKLLKEEVSTENTAKRNKIYCIL